MVPWFSSYPQYLIEDGRPDIRRNGMADDNEKTNLEVYRNTWSRLNHLKERPGETFDDVINRLIDAYENDDSG